MGTTLTGTTPQDTYDSLIKVTDNGPLTGSLKKLTDGLGNDSALSLSTGAASITGTLSISDRIGQGVTLAASTDPSIQSRYGLFHGFDELNITSNAVFNTASWRYIEDGFAARYGSNSYNGTHNFFTAPTGLAGNPITFTESFTITNAGLVGIGTSSPSDKLHVSGAGNTATFITGSGCTTYIQSVSTETRIGNLSSGGGSIVFSPADSERVRITANGLTFNGDTAAANALDDYEEGTFTPTFGGVTYSGATSNLGRYTKIGRLVHFDIFIYDAVFSSSSGPAQIGGLPFTANTQVYGQGLITYNTAIDGNTNGGYIDAGTTNFYPVDENSTAVASFINGTVSLMVSGSYTV
jgi:hypothetical protein